MKLKIFKTITLFSFLYVGTAFASHCVSHSHSHSQSDSHQVKEIVYDNFNDEGASYSAKWSTPFYGIAGETYFQDGGSLLVTFPKGKLKVSSPEFQWASETLFFDHIKYLATSNKIFHIPKIGSIEFSADIKAKTFNTVPNLTMIAHKVSNGEEVRYLLNEGRQAGATLHMLNFQETGVLFDWFVYGNQAFALYERLFNAPVYPADIQTAFTQIVEIFDITPDTHNFAIRYTRNQNTGKDKVEYLIDGKIKTRVRDIGIPLNLHGHNAVYPAQGPGERVVDLMTGMIIGHGLFSLLDVFPFQDEDSAGTSVTIPLRGPFPNLNLNKPKVNSRIWGQGAEAEFDNFKVIIRRKIQPGSSS